MGITFINLGNNESDEDKKKELFLSAQKFYEDAKDLWEKCSEEENAPSDIQKQLAYVNHNIGTVYHNIKEYDKAVHYHKEGKKIREKEGFPDRERDLPYSYLWLGKDYLKMGKKKESLKWLQKSCEMREELLGKDHPEYAWSLDALREWYETYKNKEKAIELAEQVLKIRIAALGEEHNYTERARKELKRLKEKNWDH